MTQKPIPSLLSLASFTERLHLAFSANDTALIPLLTDVACEKFYRLTEEMLRVNAFMNITAITEPDNILIKHYADCALIAPLISDGAHLCDVGCGGGFPTLPLAILRPDVRITAVDSTQKKLDYVQNTAALLALPSVTTKAARAEQLGKNELYRELFDVVCARAVARMHVLCEWCLPLVRVGGVFIAMKGRGGMTELHEAERAIKILGGGTLFCKELTLENPFAVTSEEEADAMKRTLIAVEKKEKTPRNYPRENAQITKKPL